MLESLFSKVAGLGLQLYQTETSTQMLSCEISQIFKNTYFEEHLRTSASAQLILGTRIVLTWLCFLYKTTVL